MYTFQTLDQAKAYDKILTKLPSLVRKRKGLSELSDIIRTQENIDKQAKVSADGMADYTSMRGLLGDYTEQETPTLGAFDVWRKRNLGG